MDSKGCKIFTILLLLLFIFPFVKQANGQIDDPHYTYDQDCNYEYNWLNPPDSSPFLSVWDDVWDDDHTEVDFTEPGLDFCFTFYGFPVETVYISSNGYLTFDEDPTEDSAEDSAAENLNCDLELDNPPVNIIAPFWDDLDPGKGKIYAWLDPNSSPRSYIIRWDSISYYEANPNLTVSFEVVLYEGTNKIVFNYEDVDFDPNTNDDHNKGKSASVGLRSIQNLQVFSQQYSFDGQRDLHADMAIAFDVGDHEAPVVADCQPEQNAKNVDPNTPFISFKLQDFGWGVDPNSVDVSIFLRGNDITNRDRIDIESIDVPSHVVSVSCYPTEAFFYGQVIEVQIDAADNPDNPTSNPPNKLEDYCYSFTIESNPNMPLIDPNDIPFIDPNYNCWPKPFDPNDVPYTPETIYFTIQDNDGVDKNSIIVRVEGTDVSSRIETESLDDDDKKITVFYSPPSPFSYGQEVNIVVDALDLKPIPNEMFYVYSFTIESTSGDIAPPYIDKVNPLKIHPVDGAINVPKDTIISVCICDDLYEKEKGVDPNSVVLKIGTNEVAFTSTVDVQNVEIFYYDPNKDFAYGETVTVTVEASSRDYAHQPEYPQMTETFSFTIERNYTLNVCPYQWINPPNPDDNLLTQITAKGIQEKEIEFDFMFYDQNISSVFISQYGFITLEDDFLNPRINTDLLKNDHLQPPKNIIAPFWDHLSPQLDPNALQTKIYAWQEGNSPQQRFIVQWNFIDHSHHFTDDGISFEVILNEDNTIEFYYKDIFFSSVGDEYIYEDSNGVDEYTYYTYNDGYSFGQSATIGLRSVQNGYILAQQYSHLGQEFLYDHMGMRFDPSYDPNAQIDINAPVLFKERPLDIDNLPSDPNITMSDPNIQMDPNNPFIRFTIQDIESGVDPNTIRLYIQGQDVTGQITTRLVLEDPNDPNSPWIKVVVKNYNIDCTDPNNYNVKVSYILPTAYSYGQIIFVRAIAADKADAPDYPNWMDETYHFFIPDQTPPYIIGRYPSAFDPNNITYYDPNTDISFYIIDDESGVDPNSIYLRVWVDGNDVTQRYPNAVTIRLSDDPNAVISPSDYHDIQVIYDPVEAFQDGNITVEVRVSDKADPNSPNFLEEKYTFKVVSPPPEKEFYYYLEKSPIKDDETWKDEEGSEPYWLSPPDYINPLAHGRDPNKPIMDDDFYRINLETDANNFDFEFFGQKVNTLYISSNGYLAFEDDPNDPDEPPDAANYFNQDLTLPITPRNIIAPYWDDLYPIIYDPDPNIPTDPNITTKIYWWINTDSDDPYLAIRWESIGHYFNHTTNDSISFMVLLFEKTGDPNNPNIHSNEIRFLYDDVIFLSKEDGYSQGRSATIGIRSIQGDKVFSQQYSHNGRQLVLDKMILYFNVCDPNDLALDTEAPAVEPGSWNPPKLEQSDAKISDHIGLEIKDATSGGHPSNINCQSIRLYVSVSEFDPNYDYPLKDDVTYWTSIEIGTTQNPIVTIKYKPLNFLPYHQDITAYVIAADLRGNVMEDHYSFFTEVDDSKPEVYKQDPAPDETDVPANTNIVFYIEDTGSGIDPNSIQLWINDSNIPVDDLVIRFFSPNDIRVEYDPNQDFEEGETVKIRVAATDLAAIPNPVKEQGSEYTFTIYSSFIYDPFPDQYKPTFRKYEWIERPDDIDPLDLADDDYVEVAREKIGFSFFFFNMPVIKMRISSNGYITFGDEPGGICENNDLNTLTDPMKIIAPFWDDLNPEMSGKIYAWHDANSPQRFIIQWDSVCRYGLCDLSSNPTISFEVIIYENTDDEINNKIVFQYKDVFLDSVTDEYSFGQSASVGLRTTSLGHLVSRQYSYNGQYWLLDGMAIGFDPDPNQTLPSDVDAPYVLKIGCIPEQYDPNVTADPNRQMDPNNPFIQFTIQDPNFVSGVDIDTIRLYVQNQDVTDEVTSDPNDPNIILYENTKIKIIPVNDDEDIRVSYIPSTPFERGQRVLVLAAAADMADPPNWMAYDYYFTMDDPNGNIRGPYLAEQNPSPGDTQVSPSTGIDFTVRDEDEGVNRSSIQLLVWGVDVTGEADITSENDSNNIQVEYQPLYPFGFGEEVEIKVVAYDLAVPPNKMEEEYTFTILTPEAFYYEASFKQNELIPVDPNAKQFYLNLNVDPNIYDIDFDDSYKKIFLNDPNIADPNFTFSFFGIPVNYFYVSSNGYLTFDEDSALMYINNDLNSDDYPDNIIDHYPFNIIAPYWDDLKPFTHSGPDGKGMYADIYAWSDGNRYIIRWENMGHYNCSDDPNLSLSISFDVILYEGSNRIDFQYHDVEFDYLEDGYSYGQSASIGLRSIQGQVFSQAYSYNVSSLYDDQNQRAVEAISFMPVKEQPSVITAPEVFSWSPKDDPNVPIPLDPNIYILIQNGKPRVELNEIRFYVQGNNVTDQADIGTIGDANYSDANYIEIFYKPSEDFSYGQTVTVSVAVIYGIDPPDLDFPYWMFDAYSFTVMDAPAEQPFEDETPPELEWRDPEEGERQVSPFTSIELYITDDKDGDSGVDPNSIYLLVWGDGNDVTGTTTITPDPNNIRNNIRVAYDPDKPFGYGQTVEVLVAAEDQAENPLDEDESSYTFTVVPAPDYTYSFDPNGAVWLEPEDPNTWTRITRDDGFKKIEDPFDPNGDDFTFNFYGQKVETLFISSNGYLTLASDSPIMYINTNLDPNSYYPDNIIAPYWDDLKPHTDPNSTLTKIYAWLDPNSSPRRYIIQWDSIGHYDLSEEDPNATISFEVILYENSDKIVFQYKDVIFNLKDPNFNLKDPNNDGYSKGQSATVGIRSVQGGRVFAQQYSYNEPKLKNNLAISFELYDLNVIRCTPAPSSENIPPDTDIKFQIYDPNFQIDPDSVRLYIDGIDVSGDNEYSEGRDVPNSSNILVKYEPSADFSDGQTISVYITASDVLNPLNEKDYGYSFTIESPPVVIPQFVYEVWQPEEFINLGLDAIPILDLDALPIEIYIKDEGGTGINYDPNFIQWIVEYSDGSFIPGVSTYIIEPDGGLTVKYTFVDNFEPAETISVSLQVEDLAGNKAPECKFSFMTKAVYSIAGLMTMAYDDDDMHEKFWIGTDGGGLWAFDLSDKYWDPNFYTKDDGLLGNRITSMAMDDGRFLWIVTNPNGNDPGGITQFSTESKSTVATYELSQINNDLEHINDLAIDENNVIWVATQNSGVWQLIETQDPAQDPAGRSWEQFADSNTLLVDWVEDIAVNGNVIWWVGGSWADNCWKICKCEGSNIYSRNVDPNNLTLTSGKVKPVKSLFCDVNGDVWLATKENGIYGYYGNDLSDLPSLDIDFNDDIIYETYVAGEEMDYRYWFATDKGISAFTEDWDDWLSFTREDLGIEAGCIINYFTEDGDGNIWLGTTSGLYRVDISIY